MFYDGLEWDIFSTHGDKVTLQRGTEFVILKKESDGSYTEEARWNDQCESCHFRG